MTATHEFAPGGYRFIPGVFPYSGGVAALPGHAIERVRFHTPVPLAEGFAKIRKILAARGQPLTALCACELRSPAPFTEAGFPAFNKVYVGVLAEMERRLSALGFAWHDTTATQVYTVHDLHPVLAEEIVRRGAARAGLTWHFARPPVIELEYEMDCRGVRHERVII